MHGREHFRYVLRKQAYEVVRLKLHDVGHKGPLDVSQAKGTTT